MVFAVVYAVAVCAGAAEPPSLQQQRSRAVQLCSQLQRASLLVQQQQQRAGGSAGRAAAVLDDGAGAAGGSSALLTSSSFSSRSVGVGSSTARTVLALLEDNRELLNAMPKVRGGCRLQATATNALGAATWYASGTHRAIKHSCRVQLPLSIGSVWTSECGQWLDGLAVLE